MAGRKPKPTALKKLEGNPGKRKLTKAYFLFCVDVSLNLRIKICQQNNKHAAGKDGGATGSW